MATESFQSQLSKALPGSIVWAVHRTEKCARYVKEESGRWLSGMGTSVQAGDLGLALSWTWTVYPTVHSTVTEEELARAREGAMIQTFDEKGTPTVWMKTGYDRWESSDRLRYTEEIAKLGPFVFTEFLAFPAIPPAPARQPNGILLTREDICKALDGTIIHVYDGTSPVWTTWKAEGEWWTAEKGVVTAEDADSIIDFYFDTNSGYYAICTDYPTTKEAPSVDPTVSLYQLQQAAIGSTFLTSAYADKTYRKTGYNAWVAAAGTTPYTDNQLAAWARPGAKLTPTAVSMPTSDLLDALNDKPSPRSTPVPVPVPVNTKEPIMANPNTAPTPASAAADTFDMLKDATATGLKAGVASELAERLVEKIEDSFGTNPLYPSVLKSPLGRRGLSYAAPILLYFLASAFPERLPVDPEGVKAAARYAVIGHSVKVVTPLFTLLTPLWNELASFATTEKLRGVPGGKV